MHPTYAQTRHAAYISSQMRGADENACNSTTNKAIHINSILFTIST
jgi:hypothetical protein